MRKANLVKFTLTSILKCFCERGRCKQNYAQGQHFDPIVKGFPQSIPFIASILFLCLFFPACMYLVGQPAFA